MDKDNDADAEIVERMERGLPARSEAEAETREIYRRLIKRIADLELIEPAPIQTAPVSYGQNLTFCPYETSLRGMNGHSVTVDGNIVHEQRAGEQRVHRCATHRVAQVLAARLELEAAGWSVEGPSTTDGMRLPLVLPGEPMGQALDGSRADARAQGFTAFRGGSGRRSALDVLRIDACAGLPLLVLEDRGDTAEAISTVRWHLG
ncbi:MAG: hypothetical protein ACTHU0_19075 [Kofleriaceae bacterium]